MSHSHAERTSCSTVLLERPRLWIYILEIFSSNLSRDDYPDFRVFVVFFSSSRQIPGLGHDLFPPHLSNHHSSLMHYHSTLHGVVNWPTIILTLCCFLLPGSIYVVSARCYRLSERSRWLMDCTAAMRFSTGFCAEVWCLRALMMQSWYVACKAYIPRREWIQRAQSCWNSLVVWEWWWNRLDLRERKQRDERDCIMRNYMVRTLHQITYVTVIRSRRMRWTTHEARS
jgi:hypothetical protein